MQASYCARLVVSFNFGKSLTWCEVFFFLAGKPLVSCEGLFLYMNSTPRIMRGVGFFIFGRSLTSCDVSFLYHFFHLWNFWISLKVLVTFAPVQSLLIMFKPGWSLYRNRQFWLFRSLYINLVMVWNLGSFPQICVFGTSCCCWHYIKIIFSCPSMELHATPFLFARFVQIKSF